MKRGSKCSKQIGHRHIVFIAERCSRILRVSGGMADIDAEADHDVEFSCDPALRLQQQSGNLCAIEKYIVRPFQGQSRHLQTRCADSIMDCNPRNKTKLGRYRDIAWVTQKKARIEVSLWRQPLPALAPPARILTPCNNPKRAGPASTCLSERIGVCRTGFLTPLETIPLRDEERRQGWFHGHSESLKIQNNDNAAALAASTRSEGANTKKNTTTNESAITALTPTGMPSKACFGSSKYITLTILM